MSEPTPRGLPCQDDRVPLPVAVPAEPVLLPPSLVLDPAATVGPAVPRLSVSDGSRAPAGYVIEKELGRGGMGVVYLARSLALQRSCALKMILSGAHSGDAEVDRFRTEAQAIARLQHPGIVQVFEIGEHDGRPFMALEYCPGGSLEGKLARNPLPPLEAARLVRSLAEAVQAAHDGKVIHRDLKPGNILVTDKGEPKVTDFGLAKKLDEVGQTQTGAVIGTPSYMAPEQAQGRKDVGSAADVYSLGAILYECLVGRPPFRAATTVETILQVLTEEPVAVRQLNPQAPVDLETIVHKCLQKDPTKRYATAQELADDLGRYLAAEPILARPVRAIDRAVKWVRRNPAVSGLSATVLLTLVIGAGLATWFGIDASLEAGRAKLARQDADSEAKAATAARDEADEKRKAAEMARHGFAMTAAWQAWQQNDVVRAEAILDKVPKILQQTWEYRHIRALCLRKAMTLRGHTGGVTCVAYGPDGSRVVSGSWDKTLRVWNARTGQDLITLKGHTSQVTAVAYSPDGSRIVSGSSGDALKVWDARTGQELLTLKGHTGGVTSVAYSPDGSRIASGSSDDALKVWDARSGQELLTLKGHTGGVTSVAYSPDGSTIASGGVDNTLKVWAARSGMVLLTLKGHTRSVSAVAYRPDGLHIVSGSSDRTATVWDARTGKELFSLRGHTGGVTSVAYSPDGSRIASGSSDYIVKVWQAESGQELLSPTGHRVAVKAVAFCPDGLRIISGSDDRTLRTWHPWMPRHRVSLVYFSARILASVAYNSDGSRIASASDRELVKVWDVKTGQDVSSLDGQVRDLDLLYSGAFCVAFSPDGSRIVSGSSDNALKVWDARSGQNLLSLKGHTGGVTSVAYSPDGSRIVSGGGDKKLRVWDARTGRELLTLKGHVRSVTLVAYSPDNLSIASVGRNWDWRWEEESDESALEVKVWDATTGKERFSLRGDTSIVRSLAYSPDGKHIASASGEYDKAGEVKVWDARTGQRLFSLEGHTKGVTSVAYSPDGSRIASGSFDQTVKVWDAKTGQELASLEGHADSVLSVAFSPDGLGIASASEDGTVKVWDAGTAECPNEQVEAILSARRDREFHEGESQRTKVIAPFACVFHLDRLLALSPDERPALLKRRAAVLSAALKADPNDHRSARSLARQSIAAPDTIPDAKALLSVIARHQRAALDHLHGALLLRTGNARDAAIVLRAAVRNRQPDQPPVDELLLALALAHLDRRDEARQYLAKAVAWMDDGAALQRAAALIGFRPVSPLAALGALAHASDPRLNALDPFTGHDLVTLRREVENRVAPR